MENKKSRLLNFTGRIIKFEAKKVNAGWPPACAGILHQPKRPEKKTENHN